jgi:hypothetical protein
MPTGKIESDPARFRQFSWQNGDTASGRLRFLLF